MNKKTPHLKLKNANYSQSIHEHFAPGKQNIFYHDLKISQQKSQQKNLTKSIKKKSVQYEVEHDYQIKHKKMSLRPIQSFGISQEISFNSHQKSIDSEQISVGLQMEQNKTFAFEKRSGLAEKDLSKLGNLLQSSYKNQDPFKKRKFTLTHADKTIRTDFYQENSLEAILTMQLEKGNLKSPDVKLFIQKVLGKANHDRKIRSMKLQTQQIENEKQNYDQNSSQCSSNEYLKQNIMRPYLQKEIILLQGNLEKLRKKQDELKQFSLISKEQKVNIKQNFINIYNQQCKQLKENRFN